MATPTSAKTWKGRKRIARSIELELPSGNVCLVTPMSIADMLAKGLLSDSLMPIIQQHMDKAKGKKPAPKRPSDRKPKAGTKAAKVNENLELDFDISDLMSNPEQLGKMLDGIDKGVAAVVTEPELRYHKDDNGEVIPEEDRADADVLYTDEVDLDDKMYIFNFMLGGTADSETFRESAGTGLGSVPAV